MGLGLVPRIPDLGNLPCASDLIENCLFGSFSPIPPISLYRKCYFLFSNSSIFETIPSCHFGIIGSKSGLFPLELAFGIYEPILQYCKTGLHGIYQVGSRNDGKGIVMLGRFIPVGDPLQL